MIDRVVSALAELRDRRTRARRRVEKIFSREVLGSMLVSMAMSKFVETWLAIITPELYARLAGWFVLIVVFTMLFAYWERVTSAAKEAAEETVEQAEETVEGDGDGN